MSAKTQIITGLAIISYPALFEPKANLSGALKYSCSLLFHKTDTASIEALQSAVDAATAKGKVDLWNNKVPKFRYEALRDGDAELASGEKSDKIYAGKMFLNCTSNTAPGVVDQRAQPVMDPSIIYAGCIVRGQLNAFPYKNSGNAGVAWGLNGIMFIKDGERLDGRQSATEAFAEFAATNDNDDDDDNGNDDLM